MTKLFPPLIAVLAACAGPISEEHYPFADASTDDEDAGEDDVAAITGALARAECNVQKMHDASRKFFMSRVPSGTTCAGKTTDQRWACKHPGSGRTWSVFAYDQTYIQVYRNVQASQSPAWTFVCDYSASCQLSCRLVFGSG